MRRSYRVSVGLIVLSFFFIGFKDYRQTEYAELYHAGVETFKAKQEDLLQAINKANLNNPTDVEKIRMGIATARQAMKCIDFWIRYMEPTVYKKINGPL